MSRIYLLITAIIFSVNVNAQSPDWLWANGMGGFGSDECNSIILDGQGSVYTTGTFIGTVDFDPGAGISYLISVDPAVPDIFISKTDTAGNFVWAKKLSGLDYKSGNSISFDPSGSGSIYITGYFMGQTDFDPNAGVFNLTAATQNYTDVFICKLDTGGNFIWAKSIGGKNEDTGNDIMIDPTGTGAIYCVGSFRDTVDFDPNPGIFNLISAGQLDIFVSKFDSSGNLIWAKAMGGSSFDRGISLTMNPEGGTDVYTSGYFSGNSDFDPGAGSYTLSSHGSDDIYISKLDSSGNFKWARILGGTQSDYGYSIASDIDGNVYTTGRFKNTVDFDPNAPTYNLTSAGTDDIFISKLDSSSNFVWAKSIGGVSLDQGSDITVDASGNVYLTGGFTDTVDFDPGVGVFNLISAGNIDIFNCLLDSSGNLVWVNQVGGANADNSRSNAIDVTGNLYLTGSYSSTTLAFSSVTLTNTAQSDIFVAKLDKTITLDVKTISSNQNPISVYPNPFADELTIIIPIAIGVPFEIKIIDISGRLVHSQKLTTAHTKLSTAQWQQGIYFVEVMKDEGIAITKVVKQ